MVIEFRNIKKTFPVSGEETFQLRIEEMNFEIGKTTYIMGHNGSGKSVLLRLLSGEQLPDSGHVIVKLDEEEWYSEKRHSSVVRQNAEDSLALELSVKENVLIHENEYKLINWLFPKKALDHKAISRLDCYGELLKKQNQKCTFLSGGQKQVLAFLCATYIKSKILMLDEFLSATDQSTKNYLLNLSKEYASKTPAAVIIVSHDIELALSDADRIIILKQGKIVSDIDVKTTNWNKEYIRESLLV